MPRSDKKNDFFFDTWFLERVFVGWRMGANAESEAYLNEMRNGTEEECRLSSLIVILDSSAGSTARIEHRIKIAEQLLYTINKKEAYKREFLS